ncbi:unnamed protein product [Oppiella nova]|uniref:Uncharacterized protein n=1 Tax=Oppiella nova TaxID=334625 RepID=A0A7R9QWW9_9ACAR|nr:unnamed protein product [Oppiella nova]CAG2178050.1 unnamed protein product [Oppiella nova]
MKLKLAPVQLAQRSVTYNSET